VTQKKSLFADFQPTHVSDWEKAATAELKGANPLNQLTWKGHDLTIRPYYDQSSIGTPPPPLLPVTESGFRGARTWYNCPAVKVTDAKSANREALHLLQEGTDGIFFELKAAVKFEILLKDIDWTICSLSFEAPEHSAIVAEELHRYVMQHAPTKSALHGAFFGNEKMTFRNQTTYCLEGYSFSYNPSPIHELTDGWLNILKKVLWKDNPKRLAIRVSLGPDFFLEMGKVRALRMINRRLVEAFKVEAPSLILSAHADAWKEPAYDPHGAMLKNTTVAMAAILGGCDILTLEAEPSKDGMTNRVARNISNLLREESHFSRVADPVAGSYLVEDLTRQITEAVWANLQPNLPA